MNDKVLRLTIAYAIVDGMSLEALQDKLFREDLKEVHKIYDEIKANRRDLEDQRCNRPAPSDDIKAPRLVRNKIGLGVTDWAKRIDMNRATLVSLLEHHGYLELAPYGGKQSRYLVTTQAFYAEVGHNVNPSNRVGHLEGYNKSAVFPVFYEDSLGKILWALDYEGIKGAVEAIGTKKGKLALLFEHHSYLPDDEIAALSGYTRIGVLKAKGRKQDALAA